MLVFRNITCISQCNAGSSWCMLIKTNGKGAVKWFSRDSTSVCAFYGNVVGETGVRFHYPGEQTERIENFTINVPQKNKFAYLQ